MYARPGDTITLVLVGVDPGQAEELIVSLYDEPESDEAALETEAGEAGITEHWAIPGRYAIDLLLPGDLAPDTYTVVWSGGTIDPPIADDELLTVDPDAQAPTPAETFPSPSVADVGALLFARTKEEMTRVGTFTDDTQPTGDQVTSLIARARRRVAMSAGPIGERFYDDARELTAIYAGMLIERSYFPEEIGDTGSLYQELKADFETGLAALIAASIDDTPGVKGIYSVPLRGDSAPPVTP